MTISCLEIIKDRISVATRELVRSIGSAYLGIFHNELEPNSMLKRLCQ